MTDGNGFRMLWPDIRYTAIRAIGVESPWRWDPPYPKTHMGGSCKQGTLSKKRGALKECRFKLGIGHFRTCDPNEAAKVAAASLRIGNFRF